MTRVVARRSWAEAFAVYLQAPVITMTFLGFSAGLPFLLVFSTLTAWLRDEGVAVVGPLDGLGGVLAAVGAVPKQFAVLALAGRAECEGDDAFVAVVPPALELLAVEADRFAGTDLDGAVFGDLERVVVKAVPVTPQTSSSGSLSAVPFTTMKPSSFSRVAYSARSAAPNRSVMPTRWATSRSRAAGSWARCSSTWEWLLRKVLKQVAGSRSRMRHSWSWKCRKTRATAVNQAGSGR